MGICVRLFQKPERSKGPLPSPTPQCLGSQEVKVIQSAKECVKSCLLESTSVLCAHICHRVPECGYKFRLYLHTGTCLSADIDCNYFNLIDLHFRNCWQLFREDHFSQPSLSASWFRLCSSSVKRFPCCGTPVKEGFTCFGVCSQTQNWQDIL